MLNPRVLLLKEIVAKVNCLFYNIIVLHRLPVHLTQRRVEVIKYKKNILVCLLFRGGKKHAKKKKGEASEGHRKRN